MTFKEPVQPYIYNFSQHNYLRNECMCSQYLGIRDTEYPGYQIYGWLRIESNRITDYSNETIGS